MCGRFALSITPARFQQVFGVAPPEGYRPRWNIVPDSDIVIVRKRRDDGELGAVLARWGLLGPWMKDGQAKGRQINARVETAAAKPMFRDAFERGRCLVPADGFYEWQKQASGPSRPYFVRNGDGSPTAFAGLYRVTRLASGELWRSCAILTMAAVSPIAGIHPRMPVMLEEAAREAWLRSGVLKAAEILRNLEPPDAITAFEVARAVNDPRLDEPVLIRPWREGEAESIAVGEPHQPSLF